MLDWELPQVILYIMTLLMISGLIVESSGSESGRSASISRENATRRAELM